MGQTAGKLGISCDPSYQLDVIGAGRFTGALIASSFASTSDARIKADVRFTSTSEAECTRLVQAIQPRTYRRTDQDSDARRIGYLANDWDRELGPDSEFRNIMGSALAEDGTELLALDYSRIVTVLHSALRSALARIGALESRT
jgi:hypothetical protein